MIAKDLMRKDFVSIDIEATAAELIGHLERAKTTYALVFEGKEYVGLVTKKWLLTTRIDPDVMKLKNLIKKRNKSKTPFYVPKLSMGTTLKEVARLLAASDVRALPVIETVAGEKKRHETIVGVVDTMAVLDSIKEEYRKVPASRLAHDDVISTYEDTEIGKVIKMMAARHISHMPIINKDEKLVGVVSTIDVLEKILVWGRCRGQHISKSGSHGKSKNTGSGTGEETSILSTPISNIVSAVAALSSCPPSTSVTEVIKQMVENNRASMVLVDKTNKPVGILTVKDILEDFVKG